MKAVTWRAGLVLVAGFSLLTVIGVAGHAPPVFDMEQMSVSDEVALRAYADPVRAALTLNKRAVDAEVEVAVQRWIDAYQDGRLQSVAPAHLDDTGEKGVRGEILQSRKKLSSRLQSMIARSEEKDPKAAAGWCVSLLTLNDIYKFSSPDAMTDSTYYQHSALKGLERLIPHLSKEDQANAAAVVKAMKRPSEPLGPFAMRINAAYRNSTMESHDQGMIISSALRDLSATTPEIAEAKSSKFAAVSNHEEILQMISTTMYMALRAEQRIREEADELVESLSSKP